MRPDPLVEHAVSTSALPGVSPGYCGADDLLNALDYDRGDTERSAHVYGQLRQIAHSHRLRWGGDATVCTTALVHEAYLKLAKSKLRFQSRAHFMATSSRAMRQVLVTYAEARCTQKRGGGERSLSLDEVNVADLSDREAAEIASIDESLRRLARWDERGARVVECRFFAGLTVDETAEALEMSPATVRRSWHKVRTWLYLDLHPSPAA
jgi:RNA polymerase sigma factor (TIGR02999 family)